MEGIGLLVALGVWVAASFAHLAAMKATIRSLPAEWREHPEAGPGYSAALGYGARELFAPTARIAPWVAGVVAYAVALSALGVSPGVVLVVVIGGVLWAQRTDSEDRARARAFAEREGLAYPRHPWPRRLAYRGTVYAMCVAIVASGCFAGLLLWDAVG